MQVRRYTGSIHRYIDRKLVIPSRLILFSWFPAPWIGTSNMYTLTVTSQIPHFWSGIWAQCKGILGVQDGIEDGTFSHNIKACWDGILLIFHAQEIFIFKSTTHNPGPHPTSLTMISVPSPDGCIFIPTVLLQQTKMKGNVADNLNSRHHCSQRAAD